MSSPTKAFVILTGGTANPFPSPNIATKMQAMGHDVTTLHSATGAGIPTADELLNEGYTLFGSDSMYWGITGSILTLAYQCYERGMSVITTGNDTTFSGGNPIWTGIVNTGLDSGKLNPVVSSKNHPVGQGWNTFDDTDAKIYQTGVRATATVAATFTHNGEPVPAVIVEQNSYGGRYVHVQPYNPTAPLWPYVFEWAIPGGGMGRVWNGTSWVYKPIHVFHNGTWRRKPIKAYQNGEWRNI